MTEDPGLEALLEFLKANRGFDFTGYKRGTLQRRVEKRMGAVRVEDHAEYLDYLEANPGEFAELFNTILINVTAFFRDPETWEYLRSDLIPAMMAERSEGAQLRVWTPGCASGEESYTVAMLLAEALGPAAFHEGVKIYGTDVDEDALATARHGTYSAKDLEPVPPELRDKYFEPNGTRWAFRKDLRRSVIFGRNDLVLDAPISRIDLLICRNTLMYFNTDTQRLILGRFHFALNGGGCLCLGKSEILTNASGFATVNLKRRVFRKVPTPSLRDRLAAVAPGGGSEEEPREVHARIRHGAFDQAPVAQIMVDRDGTMVGANQKARSAFELAASDSGRQLRDLSVAYRPIELGPAIETTHSKRALTELGPVDWKLPSGEECRYEVRVAPLTTPNGDLLGATITYLDVTQHSRMEAELERSKQELEGAYGAVRSSNEELETTNEELQSTNEELETTNEELQSTVEELETTNEELQSTNDELETINDELSLRGIELERVSSFMESILASLGVAVVILDGDLRVQVWNSRAEDMWGLRHEEAEGRDFLSLDTGFPAEKLARPIRDCLSGKSQGEKLSVRAVNRRGKGIDCQVSCVPLRVAPQQVGGAVLMMDETLGTAAPEGG